MYNYPEVVAKIVDDYLARVKSQLRLLPDGDREEFLREIGSHVYEAYQQMPGEDDVQRILAVLRNLGEPTEVVSDRLPATKRNLPLFVLGGILLALFGIPLGFGGLGVLLGLLMALAGLLLAFYATAGSALLVGAMLLLLGMIRVLLPGFWDQLLLAGLIQINGPPAAFFDQLNASEQGLVMVLPACALGAAGWGLLLLARRLQRGMHFLFSLALDRVQRLAQSIRRRLHQDRPVRPLGAVSVVK